MTFGVKEKEEGEENNCNRERRKLNCLPLFGLKGEESRENN